MTVVCSRLVEVSSLTIETPDTPSVHNITQDVRAFTRPFGDGLLSIFAPHSTAGLTIIEMINDSDETILHVLTDLLRPDYGWSVRHGKPGLGGAHMVPALLSTSITIPVQDGQPLLGEWQSIIMVDPAAEALKRTIRLSFLAG